MKQKNHYFFLLTQKKLRIIGLCIGLFEVFDLTKEFLYVYGTCITISGTILM